MVKMFPECRFPSLSNKNFSDRWKPCVFLGGLWLQKMFCSLNNINIPEIFFEVLSFLFCSFAVLL